MNEKPIGELEFLRKLQRLLAEKFIEYYWPQARPFRALEGHGVVLQQNTGRQASVINALVRAQAAYATLPAARHAAAWSGLVARVAATIVAMPLWKLQAVGGERDEFLYREAERDGDESIRLLPGVPAAFRALYGLVLDAVRGAWMRQITSIGANRSLLGDADLASFLFGSARASLDARCNLAKRDFLAYPAHLERWQRSHLERAGELAQRFAAARLPHDSPRTRAIAWWAYEQGEAAGAHAWIAADRFERLGGGWRDVLGGAGLRRVAEPPPPEYPPE